MSYIPNMKYICAIIEALGKDKRPKKKVLKRIKEALEWLRDQLTHPHHTHEFRTIFSTPYKGGTTRVMWCEFCGCYSIQNHDKQNHDKDEIIHYRESNDPELWKVVDRYYRK